MSVRALELVDVDVAAHALARAFHDDPLQCYVFPDPIERAARSPAHFAAVLRYGLRFGEVSTTAGVAQGAAVWLPPESWEMTHERAVEGGLDRLGEILGEAPAARFLDALGAIDPFHQTDVPREHWYLMVVGVAPEAQGRGIGRAFIQPMLKRAGDAGLPCYVETAQPSNVSFYESLGFTVVRSVIEPTSGLPMWTFRWDPPAR
jgi:ribosomal protein S18 acetylase RimI-like enzyme